MTWRDVGLCFRDAAEYVVLSVFCLFIGLFSLLMSVVCAVFGLDLEGGCDE